jgi:hypothetical protein
VDISSVTYARLFNLGNYENERIEASAHVQSEETATETLYDLKEWVLAQGHMKSDTRETIERLEAQLDRKQQEMDRLTGELLETQGFLKAAAATLKLHDIPFSVPPQEEDIPF